MRCRSPLREEGYLAATQGVVIGFDVETGGHRTVGYDEIQPVYCEIRKQCFEVAFFSHDPCRFLAI